MNNNLIKFAVGLVLLLLLVAWQQRYFNAIDDVEGSTTTLWNWPTFVLIGLGIVALLIAVYRLLTKRRG